MQVTTAFIFYTLAFRLSVIGTGLVCIVLGYRLLLKGIWGTPTEASAEVAGTRLFIKTSAPGSCFAAFGASLLIVMLISGIPELSLETVRGEPSVEGSPIDVRTMMQLKGNGDGASAQLAFDAQVRLGERYEREGEGPEAVAAYAAALEQRAVPLGAATVPLYRIARLYHQQGRDAEALPLAKIALSLSPEDADLYHLLSQILARRGDLQEALLAAARAVELRPDDTRLKESLDALGGSTP